VALVHERTIPTERLPLVGEFSVTSADRGGVTELYGRNLGFLDRSCYFFFQIAPQLYSRGEWTPFQIHYFSENLVVEGIEHGTSGSVARNKYIYDETPCKISPTVRFLLVAMNSKAKYTLLAAILFICIS
jgi:hypothetical protein